MTSTSMASSDVAGVRPGEELDLARLSEYLRDKIEGIRSGLEVQQFPSGHSNLTYLLTTKEAEYVLRRGPLGPVAPKAHDMAREYHLLRAVHPHFPQAPNAIHLCEDTGVIGAVFYIMERRRGTILRDRIPEQIQRVPDHPKLISEAFIDGMAGMHSIAVDSSGLIALGKADGFLARQVKGWTERWQRAKTEDLPEMEMIAEWLTETLPESGPATLVHNDYKLDNVMLSPEPPFTVEAVLDWEMATIGDPLADVGLTLCYWTWAAAPQFGTHGVPALTAHPGWCSREQFLSRYAERTGRDVTHVLFYEVLGIFKLAVILQQIYFRFHRGQTSDVRFRDFNQRAKGLARLAATLVEGNS